ncbi:MAG: hypothetical protein HQL48_07700 [Gammaproteobacteria bacterium]|nr:hypothetical protein [Gammaproteobacteria bacterium]
MMNYLQKSVGTVVAALLLATTGGAVAAGNGVADDITIIHPAGAGPQLYLGGSVGQAGYRQADDSDIGLDLYAGVRINDFLGAELGWSSLGEIAGGDGLSAVHGEVVGFAALRSNLLLFAKAGLAGWRHGDDSSSDLLLGLGLDYSVGRNVSARFAVTNYDISADTVNEDVTLYSAGLRYSF